MSYLATFCGILISLFVQYRDKSAFDKDVANFSLKIKAQINLAVFTECKVTL